MKLQEILKKFEDRGYVAWYYPRKKQIAISGGRCISVEDGIKRMLEILNSKN